jgi:predicted AAA+ superfamily ATPase
MYIREITNELLDVAKSYPVVTLIGPRQSGKTTLVRNTFPNLEYVNLEAPDIRQFAQSDPRAFLNSHMNGVILDEIQRVPELLSYIQVTVDEKKEFGKFILTGSHQLMLHQAITQSLAGRTALLTLLPMTLNELINAKFNLNVDQYMLNGCFPRVYSDNLVPIKAYRNYFQTYIERDVRQMINIKDIALFEKFIKICASRVGQIINKDSIGNELGISGITVSQWLSILEASFIIHMLPPYFENFGKRIIKSSKLYFTDTGLAAYLLGIENIQQLSRDPLRGFLFENLVILELIKTRLNMGMDPEMYFYRDSHQNEIDVVYKKGHELVPIEIKAAQTFNTSFLRGLNFYQNLVNDRVKQKYLIYTGEYEQLTDATSVINYKNTHQIILNVTDK